MNRTARFIRAVGRFSFGLGIGLALTCALVIVSTGTGAEPRDAAAAREAVRLEPVTVIISAERFAAIRADVLEQSALARSFDRKRNEV